MARPGGASAATTAAVVVAALLEAAFGEPPRRSHPVAWFGRLVAPADRAWSRPRLVGLGVAFAAPVAAGAAVACVVVLAWTVRPWVGALAAAVGLFVTTSLRMLLAEARRVIGASATDLPRARDSLRSLAGRDAADLSAGQVRSAAVESAAENLADGLVAPLGAFVAAALLARPLGPSASLALGAGAAAWVKAVNTLDSMLGYRSKPVGWAPARLDDLAMWLPARAAAVLLALACSRPTALADARPWLAGVPSPNSGWPMGVLAAAADVRLEKPAVYVLNPGGALPSVERADAAVRSVAIAGLVAYALAAVTVAATEVGPWS